MDFEMDERCGNTQTTSTRLGHRRLANVKEEKMKTQQKKLGPKEERLRNYGSQKIRTIITILLGWAIVG